MPLLDLSWRHVFCHPPIHLYGYHPLNNQFPPPVCRYIYLSRRGGSQILTSLQFEKFSDPPLRLAELSKKSFYCVIREIRAKNPLSACSLTNYTE